jgi:hypothetical protein
MKVQKNIFTIETAKGFIDIKENVEYKWCKQLGFFRLEDNDIIAWYPGSYERGTPSYFSIKNILNISDNYSSFPTPNKI